MSELKYGHDLFFQTEDECQAYQKCKDTKTADLCSTLPRPIYMCGGVEKIHAVDLSTISEPGPRIDILDGLIPENHITILYGDGGQGKSYLALAIANSIAAGCPFLNIPTKSRRVLYIDWELDQDEHARRAYKIARGNGLKAPFPGVLYYRATEPITAILLPLQLYIQQHNVGLLILDSLGAASGGDPEQAKLIIPMMASLRSLGTTILALDHQAKMQEGQSYKNKSPFGSAYKFNLARSVIQSQRVGSKNGELSLILRPTKYNLDALKEDIPIKLLFAPDTVSIKPGNLDDDPTYWDHLPTDKKIISSLHEDGPATAQELSDKLDIKRGTITNTLGKLKREGRVVEFGKNNQSPIYSVSSTPPHIYMGSVDVEDSLLIEDAKEILDAREVTR